MAARAMTCSIRRGEPVPLRRLSVIDYSRPSTQPRMWVFDLERPRLLFEEWVAHGRNTGENLATRFSNATGSYMSSLGSFVTQESYSGANGYSLRLQGLEPVSYTHLDVYKRHLPLPTKHLGQNDYLSPAASSKRATRFSGNPLPLIP